MEAKIVVIVFMGLLLLAVVAFSPFFTIWSLNHLFHTEIPLTFKSWCAVIWLLTVLHGIRMSYNKSE
jgi:hypothetical protein